MVERAPSHISRHKQATIFYTRVEKSRSTSVNCQHRWYVDLSSGVAQRRDKRGLVVLGTVVPRNHLSCFVLAAHLYSVVVFFAVCYLDVEPLLWNWWFLSANFAPFHDHYQHILHCIHCGQIIPQVNLRRLRDSVPSHFLNQTTMLLMSGSWNGKQQSKAQECVICECVA